LKKSCLFILLFLSIALNAQVRHLFDTIRYDLTQKKKFFIGFDGKNNVVSDIRIKMFGLKGGFIYNSRTSFYIGFYNTYGNDSQVSSNPTAIAPKTDTNTVFSKYGMGYINYGCEYIFHNSRRWQLSVPVAIGIGAGRHTKVSRGRVTDISRPGILPFETGLNASYKLAWWLWIDGGLGTRISFSSNHEFNGPFYNFGFSIKTEAIIKKARDAIREYREMR
jgi:hypothetical protein